MSPFMDKARIISLTSYGSVSSDSCIIVAEESKDIPFTVKRVYWICSGNEASEHGDHAHLNPEQVLVAVSGTVKVEVTDRNGLKGQFLLDSPCKGLFIPPKHWLLVRMDAQSTLLCLSSHSYAEQETINDLNEFLSAG
jgi:hypothetical protein